MNHLKSMVLFAFMSQIALAQTDNCGNPNCLTNSLIINTGYNHSAGSAFPVGQQDPYWILKNAPTTVTVNLNGPANVIAASPWSAISSNSRYISAFPTSGSNAANISPSINPYSFERCFCVCEDNVKVEYDITVRVDNQVKFYIGSTLLPGQPAQLSTTTTANFNTNNKFKGSIGLNKGRHCLRAEVRNDNEESAMGLNIEGTLSTVGNKLQREACCNNQGFITGYKFRDENCNGRQDTGEPYLQGWQIQVNGNGVSLSATTDANGYYTFTVPAGTYTVSEVMQSGWSPTTPTGGSQAGVTVAANSIQQVIFGNCPKPLKEFCCPGENLIRNGNFEAGNTGFSSQYTFNGATTTWATLPGQYNIVTGAQALSISSGWIAQDPGTCSNTSGKFLAVNGSTCGSGRRVIWEQTIPVKEWASYKFCASAKNLKQCDFDVKPKIDVEFSFPVGNLSQTLNVGAAACNWYQFSKNIDMWGYGSSLTIKIYLDESSLGDGNDVALDNIALLEIPKCPPSAAVFQITTQALNATDYQVTATSSTTPQCNATWWKVCEWDMSTNSCVPGTIVENPSTWWTANTTFPGYTFKYGKLYKISRGTWGECHGWGSFDRFVGSSLRTKRITSYTQEQYDKNLTTILNSLK